jgi:regulatory protein
LADAGFTALVVDETVERLVDLGLIDDEAFAGQWVRERASRKGLGDDALVMELTRRGIEREIAEAAVAQAIPDEESRAIEVAVGWVGKLGDLSQGRQAARLEAALARRGFSEAAVEGALRAVLPPEGWD